MIPMNQAGTSLKHAAGVQVPEGWSAEFRYSWIFSWNRNNNGYPMAESPKGSWIKVHLLQYECRLFRQPPAMGGQYIGSKNLYGLMTIPWQWQSPFFAPETLLTLMRNIGLTVPWWVSPLAIQNYDLGLGEPLQEKQQWLGSWVIIQNSWLDNPPFLPQHLCCGNGVGVTAVPAKGILLVRCSKSVWLQEKGLRPSN